jgi:hypothetical protein
MKYGQIAGNKSINVVIYRCFEYLPDEDARLFARKFREQSHNNEQVMHTFRELLVGGFLGWHGFSVRYNRALDGKTPDWSILDQNSVLQAVVELVNFHADRATESDIERDRAAGLPWVGWMPSHVSRLYDRIHQKASVYKELVERKSVAYVVAVYSEFTANVDISELRECLLSGESGLFHLYPSLSGALFFEERSGHYPFTYIESPHAARKASLPSGEF